MAQKNVIRLLIADDQEIVRIGLRALLKDTDIKIIAEVTTGPEAVKYVMTNDVDVALLDVRMPEGDGLIALARIKLDKAEVPVLIYSAFDNPMYCARAVALGASGFLLKTATRDEVVTAIQTAAAGETTWTRADLRRMSGALAAPRLSADVEVSLTKRESEVLRQVATGATNKEIAEVIHTSYETVNEHVQRILERIGVSDRTQAAVWAVRNGLA